MRPRIWIHATPHSDFCQKSQTETHTPRNHRPYSHVHFTNFNTTSHPDSFLHFHFILFSQKNSHSEQISARIKQKNWKDSISTFSHHLSVKIIEVILGPNYIFPLLNPYSYEKCLKKNYSFRSRSSLIKLCGEMGF